MPNAQDDPQPDARTPGSTHPHPDTPVGRSLEGGWWVGPVPKPQRAAGMSMVITGRITGGGAAVGRFEAYVRRQHLNTQSLWGLWEPYHPDDRAEADRPAIPAAFNGPPAPQQLRAAALAVPSPGKTAMLFVSPISQTGNASRQGGQARLGALARLAGDHALAQDTHVVQSLLDPGQTLEQEALLAGGFHRLAKLVYMHRDADSAARHANLDLTTARLPPERRGTQPAPAWHVFHYTPSRHRLFADAVLASYQDTRDCPGLLGLRPIDEVLAGHRGTGQFDPALWSVVCLDDQPAAVMLLAGIGSAGGWEDDGTYELVYLGVAKPFRGLGLGRRLLHHGLARVHQRGGRRMLLAVDDRNDPAVGLYRAMGFRATARKLAMIRHHPRA